MFVTVYGIVTDISPEQSSNAFSSILTVRYTDPLKKKEGIDRSPLDGGSFFVIVTSVLLLRIL